MRWWKATAAVLLAAAALSLAGATLKPLNPSGRYAESPPPIPVTDQIALRLKQSPHNWLLWAQLGQSYLEQARVTANPAFYQKAESALNQSLQLNHKDNFTALTGLGSLANTRHDFAKAASLSRDALALNSSHAPAYGVLADALTQLGTYDAATQAIEQMLNLDPGLPALSRAAYDLEQHGKPAQSRALWERALRNAQGASAAFVQEQLGNLSYHAGDFASATASYQAARTFDAATGVAGRHGLARVAVANGQWDRAREIYRDLTAARPDPVWLAEYASLLTGTERAQTLTLAQASLDLLAANGSSDDLAGAQVAIARGDYATAVTLTGREWQRRKHTDVADVLAWALHLAGHDSEALVYAHQALSLGIQHREYSAHLHAIEEALS